MIRPGYVHVTILQCIYAFSQACFTPLHVAAELGSTDIVEELVRRCPTKEFLNDHMVR